MTLLICGCSRANGKSAPWTDAEGGFAIEFPHGRVPKDRSTGASASAGKELHSFRVIDGEAEYGVTYYEAPPPRRRR